jgi:hypothetical protein
MFVTITSLRLKSVWGFFKLSLFGLKISNQAKKEIGFKAIKNTGFGYMHYTLTLWQTEDDLKRFAKSGEHLNAMKEGGKLANEIYTYTYSADQMPDWATAKKLLREKGKQLTFH